MVGGPNFTGQIPQEKCSQDFVPESTLLPGLEKARQAEGKVSWELGPCVDRETLAMHG